METENIEIHSLQEFIGIFEKEEFNVDFYFRGEPKDYSCTHINGLDKCIDTCNMASGYRWMLEKNKMFDDLLELRFEYYREIGHTLNSKETENFISYSQHHGLPTELLDITANPVVALYFACEKYNDEDGYVYLFNNTFYGLQKEHKKKFYYNMYQDVTSSLITEDIKKQKIRFRWTSYVPEGHLQTKQILEHNQFVYSMFSESDIRYLFHEAKKVYLKLKNEDNRYHIIVNDNAKKIFESESIEEEQKYYKEIFGELEDSELYKAKEKFCIDTCIELIGLGDGKYFPNLKLLLFKPSIVFDRMRNQDGAFIYQLNHEQGDRSINQKVKPSYILSIPKDKKKKILSQLDSIGINQKFIYPDVDNVASYLKNNYSRSVWKERHPGLIDE